MARRLHQTTADYVVIAVSPALIMTLVGSLVFFLIQVLYQGQFEGRLNWVVACFVFAAVLIGRISIEEGFERAAPFGIALAIVVGIALNRFVEIKGSWVANFTWAINFALLGLVWWCAHRLTWDCTLIDDSQDASGEGLLQTAGLERKTDEEPRTERPEPLIEGTTVRSNMPVGWWQQFVERQRRPHAPGVWVVYFSLAALPLFGIGQWFIPAANLAGRRHAFWLLCVYVASGLGLLLTTSFLGLRRYLRQRRIEMPTLMANLWLGMGATLILSLLIFSALLPRPSAEYAIAQLPFEVGSPDQRASRAAPVPKEGTHDKQPGAAPEPQTKQEPQAGDVQPQKQPEEAQKAGGSQGKSSAKQQAESQSSGKQTQVKTDQPNSANKQSDSQGSGQSGQGDQKSHQADRSSGKSQPSQQQSRSSNQQGDSQSNQRGDQKPAQPNRANPQQDSKPPSEVSQLLQKVKEKQEQQSRPPEPKPQSEQQPPQQKPESRLPPKKDQPQQQDQRKEQPQSKPQSQESAAPAETPKVNPEAVLEPALGGVAELAKWAFYAAVVLGVLYVLWRSRAEVWSAIRELLAGLRDFWNGLWGRKRVGRIGPSAEAILAELPPPPFSSYADPFATGIAGRYSTEELVRYSFEAFEAWAREHGCPRQPDQTPHELARDVSGRVAAMAPDARNLAELYSRAAYDRTTLPKASAEQLRELWQHMRTRAARSF
ncbi:MAG: DUF4129 domain-containing protein [Planctomycetia bacterium]|nr:DUF4129 domain-containing protein [Planctomycetia bacterium]